jgi:hypothetical protein
LGNRVLADEKTAARVGETWLAKEEAARRKRGLGRTRGRERRLRV